MSPLYIVSLLRLAYVAVDPATLPKAQVSASVPTIRRSARVVVLVHGRAPFKDTAATLIEKPLAEQMTVIPWATYRRAVRKAHLRGPLQLATAQRMARRLDINYAISISAVESRKKRSGPLAVEVIVAQMRPKNRVMMVQRFLLPKRKLTAGMADSIVARIEEQTEPPSGLGPLEEGSPPVTPDLDSGGPEAPITPEDKASEATETTPPAATIEAPVKPQETPSDKAYRLAIGLAVTQRQARLETPTTLTASLPCYCGDALLANTFPGLYLAAEWVTERGIGVQGDGTVFVATTPIESSQNYNVKSLVALWHANLIYKMSATPRMAFIPQLGYAFFHFPLADGVFPGLAYNSPSIGIEGRYEALLDTVSVKVSYAYLPFLRGHDDSVRLGTRASASGWSLRGGVEAELGFVQLGGMVSMEQFTMAFSGKTYLYMPQRFDDVVLQDRLLQLVLTVGSHL